MVQQRSPLTFLFFHSCERFFCLHACVRLWACHPAQRAGRFQPALLLKFHSTRAVQQWYHTSKPRIGPKAYQVYRNACVPPFKLATSPGFQANHSPKRNLVHTYYITRYHQFVARMYIRQPYARHERIPGALQCILVPGITVISYTFHGTRPSDQQVQFRLVNAMIRVPGLKCKRNKKGKSRCTYL